LLIGCKQAAQFPTGDLISTAGSFAPPGQEWILRVESDGAIEVERDYTNQQGGTRTTTRLGWQPRAGWFVFIESADRFWMFDGNTNLSFYWFKADGSRGRYSLDYFQGVVPQRVISALPNEVRETVNRVGSKAKDL
jgi:hypothetical protein